MRISFFEVCQRFPGNTPAVSALQPSSSADAAGTGPTTVPCRGSPPRPLRHATTASPRCRLAFQVLLQLVWPQHPHHLTHRDPSGCVAGNDAYTCPTAPCPTHREAQQLLRTATRTCASTEFPTHREAQQVEGGQVRPHAQRQQPRERVDGQGRLEAQPRGPAGQGPHAPPDGAHKGKRPVEALSGGRHVEEAGRWMEGRGALALWVRASVCRLRCTGRGPAISEA